MYKKESRIISNVSEFSNYLKGSDVYNSKLLYRLSDPEIDRVSYEITTYEYRPDLIAIDFYGSIDYLPYVILNSGIGLEQFTKGTVIKLIPKETILGIINSL